MSFTSGQLIFGCGRDQEDRVRNRLRRERAAAEVPDDGAGVVDDRLAGAIGQSAVNHRLDEVADGVLRRSLDLSPDNGLAIGGLGSLALSRHRFRDALRYGLQALAGAEIGLR